MRHMNDIAAGNFSLSSEELQRQCPNCNAPVCAPSKFCSTCGTRIESFTVSGKISPSSVSLVKEANVQPLTYRALMTAPFHVTDLLSHREVPKTLRELYLDLGIVLLRRQEYLKAIEAFCDALKVDGATPETIEILLYQAYAYEVTGDHKFASHGYLEAIIYASEYIKPVLLHVQKLLTSVIVMAQGYWITREWAMRIAETQCDPVSRMHIALFIGRVNLYLTNYTEALKQFKEAVHLAPDEALIMAEILLEPEMLPQAYTKAEAMQFKAQLLEFAGKQTEAALCFYEAGRSLSWGNEHQIAIELLTKAIALDPRNKLAYWHLANALRLSSYTPSESPYLNKEKIEESLVVWEKGKKIALPGPADSWAYVVRALINQSQAVLSTDMNRRRNLLWEAVAYLERALLLYQKDAYRWAFLGRFHRILNNEASALAATENALTYDDEDLVALDERAAILANVGQFADAEKAIDKRRKLEPSIWADGIKAYILAHTGRYQEAEELVSELINIAPQELSYRGLRALCYKERDQFSSALEEYQFIWDQHNSSDMNNQSTFGWAAYKLGLIDEAIEIFSTLRHDPAQEQSSIYWNLGLSYLAKGDISSGEKNLERGTALAINPRQLDDIEKFDFLEIEKSSSGWTYGVQVHEVLGRIREKIAKRRVQLSQKTSIEEELKRVIASLTPPFRKKVENTWIGVHAGLARFYMESKRWSEATEEYRLLQQYAECFPEARKGLEAIPDVPGAVPRA